MRINTEDLDRHGYTDGCVQCTYIRRHRRARPGASHSHTCRARMMEAIGQAEAGKRRIAQHHERTNELMARELERADRLQARAPAPPPTEFLPATSASAQTSVHVGAVRRQAPLRSRQPRNLFCQCLHRPIEQQHAELRLQLPLYFNMTSRSRRRILGRRWVMPWTTLVKTPWNARIRRILQMETTTCCPRYAINGLLSQA